MTLPAVRITDTTVHGGKLVMGCPTVLIGNLPASRIGDTHVCPMVTGLVPHVGGPLVIGAFTVLVGGSPQSRVTDTLVCVGPPDTMAQGEPTVLVGMAGAAGALGALKGAAMAGVLMTQRAFGGGEPVVNIKVEGDAAFSQAVRNALSTVFPAGSGTEWLCQMGENRQEIVIRPTADQNGYCEAHDAADAGNGVGTGSTVHWNPNFHTLDPSLPGPQGSPGSTVILFHEMVHGLHNANGDNRNGPYDSFPGQTGSSARNEERSTVGTPGPVRQPDGTQEPDPPDYSRDVPTENSLRDDLGIPRRPSYYPSNWPGGAPW